MSYITPLAPLRYNSENPRISKVKRLVPINVNSDYYNYYRKGHYASTCPKTRRVDLKEIKREGVINEDALYEDKDSLYESGKEEP